MARQPTPNRLRTKKPLPKAELLRRKAAHATAAEMNVRTRVAGKHGERNRRILVEFVRNGIEHRFHATKGWRRNRAAA